MKKFVISMLLFFPIFVLAQQSDQSVFVKFDSCKDSEIKILKLQNDLQEIILAGTQVKFFLDAAEELRRDMRTRVAGSSQGSLS